MGIFEWSLDRLSGAVPDPSAGRERFDAALAELVTGLKKSQSDRPLYDYLEALQAWLVDCPGYYANRGASMPIDAWALLADALKAAKEYE